MKAVVLNANEKLDYEEVALPEIRPGCVRIRIAVCGICGSDIPRVYDHAAHNYPVILGHEFSGIVDAIGEGVDGFKKGEHVVAAPLVPCMTCPDCRKGNYSLCSRYSFVGSRQQGAMADYVVVPAENVIPISESLSFEQAATIEPATVGLHALRIANFTEGKSVAVLGCGIIGLYTAAWAKILGASSVTAISRGKRGLEAAARMGADEIISTEDFPSDGLPDYLKERKFDYVMECSGSGATIHLAMTLVGKKGVLCFVGTPKKPLTFTIQEWEQINRKECWVTGSWMSYSAPFPGEEWRMAVREMENGRLLYDEGLVYGIYPMEDAREAFEAIHSGKAKGRVLLTNGL